MNKVKLITKQIISKHQNWEIFCNLYIHLNSQLTTVPTRSQPSDYIHIAQPYNLNGYKLPYTTAVIIESTISKQSEPQTLKRISLGMDRYGIFHPIPISGFVIFFIRYLYRSRYWYPIPIFDNRFLSWG